MDNPKITQERSGVPDWARSPEAGTAQQVAEEALGGAPKISDPQRSFLLDLIQKKQIKPEHEGKVDLIMKCLRISEDPEEYGMSRDKASELITWFLKQKDKPREQQVQDPNSPLMKLAPGRYAIENSKGELRFYQLWESHDKKAHRLYVMFGPYEAKLPMPAQQAIAQKILDADPKKCALRFGAEIGSCSNCGRRLTNRISRELSIGPICGDRMFDDEWASMKQEARDAIIARGEDPDEEINDEVREPHFTGDFV